MKKLYLLSLLISTCAFPQKNYDRYYNSWRFGLNIGGMWQTADVRSTAGVAGGFTLEKGLLENKTHFFSLAIRGRGLFGNTYGLDYTRNYNVKSNPALNGTYNPAIRYDTTSAYVYNNYRTQISEGALELQVSFNRLRERTGIILNLWGGVGITSYRTNVDLLDANGKMYNYYKVDSTGKASNADALAAHSNLLDKKYESYGNGSKANNVITFAPSAGIGWGYQFGPGFSMILEYKVTFPQGPFADYLDGITGPNKDWIAGSKDYYHYAGLNLLFRLGGGGHKTHTTTTDVNNFNPVTTHTTVTTPTASIVSPTTSVVEETNGTMGRKPAVKIVNPPYSPFNVSANTFNIRAKVTNVYSRNQLSVLYNGSAVSQFNYDGTHIEFPVLLVPGSNQVQISASTPEGSDSKSATIIYQGAPPVVTINSPSPSPYNTTVTPVSINANVANVSSANDISVKFNGNAINFFSYSLQTGVLTVQLPLNKGSNMFEITATNPFGQDYKNLTLNYSLPVVSVPTATAGRPVSVTILDPAQNPYQSSSAVYNVKSKVTNVGSASQVTVTVNGSPLAFNFNAGMVTFSPGLITGANIIVVSANNGNSFDSKSTIINYVAPKLAAPPTVVILNPSPSPHVTNFQNYFFKAQVQNISSMAQLEVKFNGNVIGNYLFNPSTGLIEFNTTLTPNMDNIFDVKATNSDGSASGSGTVKYKVPVDFNKPKVICHHSRGGLETITINETEWPMHQAHGDTEGPCPDPQITICHKNMNGSTQTMTITQSQWASHQAHGDQMGECPKITDEGGIDPMITICHNGAGGIKQTMSIKASEWASHQAHGDFQGPCPKVNVDGGENDPNIVICHKNTNGTRQTMTIKQSEWLGHKTHGDTQGECTMTICHNGAGGIKQTIDIKESEWATHQAHGDILGPCPKADVGGTEPEATLVICHKNANGTYQTMTINQSEWMSHKLHGDSQGECKITICHHPPGNPDNTQQLEIPESAWPAHLAHGDTKGTCPPPEKKITICHNAGGTTQTIEIKESEWPAHQAHGDVQGACPPPENKIIICHHPPGNPDNTQQLEIPESAWPAHQAHGDTKGTCPPPEKKITICHNEGGTTQTIEIKESEWPAHQAHGDMQGTCPEKKIIICHHPPGNPDNTQQLEIPESAWPAHQAHGDTKGNCPPPENKITICHHPPGNPTNTQEIQIPESAWPAHEAHGDTKGACPPPDNGGNTNNGGHNDTIRVNSNYGNGNPGGEQKITICHHPPGNPTNTQEIQIPVSAWPAHQAHGDTQGPCNQNNNGNSGNQGGGVKSGDGGNQGNGNNPGGGNNNSGGNGNGNQGGGNNNSGGNGNGNQGGGNNNSGGNGNQGGGNGNSGGNGGGNAGGGNSQGGGKGDGGMEKKITICHIPPGNNSNPQTIEIPESAWPAHEAHGDSKGACSQARMMNNTNPGNGRPPVNAQEGEKKQDAPANEGGQVRPAGGRPR